MASTCTRCGKTIALYDEFCSCCGSRNPAYRFPDRETVIFLGQGQDAYRAGKYEAAIQSLSDALDLAPEVVDAHLTLAAAYSATGRYNHALTVTQKAHNLRPCSAAIVYNLGWLCQHTGRKAEAKKHYEQALALAQKDTAIADKQYFLQTVRSALETIKE